ncbi:MAG: alpha/beta hydrolase [Chloroflexota bacterium]|nr:alpha/beta hydrolase [Chloroflexota bacterium]
MNRQPKVEHHDVNTNGIRLHVAQAGPEEGPLVILLHGFPGFWYGWQYQIPYLAGLGFRVWVPDQRGYNLSEKPSGVAAYNLDALAADVVGLVDAAGRDTAHLVGHDWGASVAWRVAARYPERVERLVILNMPHPAVIRANVRRNPAQFLRSLYVLFFQIPWLPETLLRLGNWAPVVQALKRSSRPNTFSERDLARYRQAWSQPGAFTSMIDWYRAAVRRPPQAPIAQRITVPTLIIWGVHDPALLPEMAEQSLEYVDDGQLVFLEEATHWVKTEEPEHVNELIGNFLQGSRQQH